MKISVIVPIYNADKYLDKCIGSIVGQSYRNLEIILINDGSLDSSREICRRYESGDVRIVYIEQKNSGVVATRRKGISCARGDYVTFVDADDFIDPDTYKTLAEKLDGRFADVVAFGILEEENDVSKRSSNRIPEGYYTGDDLEERILPRMLSGDDFFFFGIIPTVFSKLFRTEFLKQTEIIIDDSITFGEDVALTFQALIRAESVQIIDHASYHYIKRRGSMTWDRQSEDNIRILENTLREAFSRTGKLELMHKQLDEYMTFVRLLKAPETVAGVRDFFSQKEMRVALYGAGGFGQAIHHEYKEKISLWVDRDYQKYDFLDGEVDPVDVLVRKTEEYDVIYIAIINEALCRQIRTELVEKGITKDIQYFEIYPNVRDE